MSDDTIRKSAELLPEKQAMNGLSQWLVSSRWSDFRKWSKYDCTDEEMPSCEEVRDMGILKSTGTIEYPLHLLFDHCLLYTSRCV